jgi:hypothetical protein
MEKGIGGPLKLSREQHFTVVFLANAHPNAYVSCSLILKLPPLYHTTCLLLLIKKFNQLYFQGCQHLLTHPEENYNGPYQDTGL